MRDDVNYRCVNHSCARALPRQVNYCPYCGINQRTALPRAAEPRAGLASVPRVALEKEIDAASGAAAGVGYAGAAVARSRAGEAGPAPASMPPPQAPAPPFTADATAAAGAFAAPAAATAPHAAAASAATGPRPFRLRWILLVLAAIWLAWVVQRPTSPAEARTEKRIERAMGLAKACKPNEAQAELIALQSRASAAQLARLQAALDKADSDCHPERARAAGTTPSRTASTGAAASARRRTGADSTRNLLSEARAAMARGDYRAAADKMEVCVAMVDTSPAECQTLKARAERLDADQQRCLQRGARWLGGQCQ